MRRGGSPRGRLPEDRPSPRKGLAKQKAPSASHLRRRTASVGGESCDGNHVDTVQRLLVRGPTQLHRDAGHREIHRDQFSLAQLDQPTATARLWGLLARPRTTVARGIHGKPAHGLGSLHTCWLFFFKEAVSSQLQQMEIEAIGIVENPKTDRVSSVR